MGGLTEYEDYDAIGLAELVRKGDVTPGELLDEACERVEERNPQINAIIYSLVDAARAEISAGLPDGPFRGVPFLMKDLHASVAGAPLTNGSKLFKDAIASHDSELVRRYRRAGLVIFGKTNTPELGLSVSTEPALFGACRNPYNLDRTTGGSSGGAGASVAARILPAAHASDGGGSIRIPAACCGLFGLKPTRGRTPMGPEVSEGWAGMSAQHVVSMTVRDSAALLDATHGAAAGDPYAAPAVDASFLSQVGRAPGRLRIAISTAAFNGSAVDDQCVQAAEDAARLCEQLGHDVEIASPNVDTELQRKSTATIIGANTLSSLTARAAALGRTLAEDDVEKLTYTVAQMGAGASAADYSDAVRGIHALGRELGSFFEDYDVLLTPMLARPPIPLGILDMNTDDPASYIDALVAFTAFSQLFNATGQPAMSVPLAMSNEQTPIGVQFAGRFGDEATLLRLAAQLETASPWRDRMPSLLL